MWTRTLSRSGGVFARPLWRSAAVLVLGGLLGGASSWACASSAAEAEAPAPEPGSAVVRLDNHLGFPYALEQLDLLVDGQPVRRVRTDDREVQTAWAGPLHLSPGRHVLVARVVISYPNSPAGARCRLELRTVQLFAMDRRAATIGLDLHAQGVTDDFSRRVALAVRAVGARLVPLDALRATRVAEQHCGSSEAVGGLLCRAEIRAQRAGQQHDAAADCYAAKLDSMRELASVRRRWLQRHQEEPDAAAPAGKPINMVLITERRIRTLWGELEQCAPHESLALQPELRRISGQGCRGTEPLH